MSDPEESKLKQVNDISEMSTFHGRTGFRHHLLPTLRIKLMVILSSFTSKTKV